MCLERETVSDPLSSSDSGIGTAGYYSKSSRYRKRVLYAHSNIIKLRSEYLDDWIRFSSTDHQGPPSRGGANRVDRAVHSVTCLDVDFVTMYWFLYFLYTGELEFRDVEDTANTAAFSIESLDRGIAEHLVSDSPEGSSWDWKTLVINDDGSTAVETLREKGSPNHVRTSRPNMPAGPQQSVPAVSTSIPAPQEKPTRPPSGVCSTSQTRQGNSGTVSPTSAVGSATLQVAPLSRTLSSPNGPKQTTPPRFPPSCDPHAHPTNSIPPASAFAIYTLAHRYQLDELARLAKNHLLSRLKPCAACSLLLASFKFKDLHAAVEDFVISHWDEVRTSVSPLRLYPVAIAVYLTCAEPQLDFIQAIQDIASGS